MLEGSGRSRGMVNTEKYYIKDKNFIFKVPPIMFTVIFINGLYSG